SIGLQPDVLLCRSDHKIPDSSLAKIALFTNVERRAVIGLQDVNTIYKIPSVLHAQGLDDFVVEKLQLKCGPANLDEWTRVVDAQLNPQHDVTIAMVGKYTDLADAYKSLNEALLHAGIQTRTKVHIDYVDSEDLEHDGVESLAKYDGILVPGGFGKRGTEGKIAAIQYARENGVPYLGICLGMQLAVIEFARNVAGLEGANSTEFDPSTPHPVVALITEWQDREGQIERRDSTSDLGGTMRKGAQRCPVKPNTRAHAIYGNEVYERHRHRYEVNNAYVPR